MAKLSRYIARFGTAFWLTAGGLSLASCAEQQAAAEENVQGMMTQQSENLTVLHSKNGRLAYRFTTPLMERYELAAEPFTEFRKGIHIETYNDSTQQVESSLTANYAIYLEKQKLWEAKGNVKGSNAKGEQLETEQLFWNEKSKLVYSNVDTKVTRGNDVIYGEGFESDERLENYQMRFPKGKVTVNTEPNEEADSARMQRSALPAEKPAETNHPVIREGEAVAKPKAPETESAPRRTDKEIRLQTPARKLEPERFKQEIQPADRRPTEPQDEQPEDL